MNEEPSAYERFLQISEELDAQPYEPLTLKVPDWAYPGLMAAIERVGYPVAVPLEPVNFGLRKRRSLLR
jgi:hypothetical protein